MSQVLNPDMSDLKARSLWPNYSASICSHFCEFSTVVDITLNHFKDIHLNSGWTSGLLAWAPESVALPIAELRKSATEQVLGRISGVPVCRCYSWHAYHVSKWKCGESSRMYMDLRYLRKIQSPCLSNLVCSQFSSYLLSSKIWLGEGDGTPLQYSCLENPMDGRAW